MKPLRRKCKNSVTSNQINNALNILFEFDFLILFSIFCTPHHTKPCFFPFTIAVVVVAAYLIFASDNRNRSRICNACTYLRTLRFSTSVTVCCRLSEHLFHVRFFSQSTVGEFIVSDITRIIHAIEKNAAEMENYWL